jgi:antitoxin component HigA of HigAB toxin-antitoxin module
MMWWMMTIGLLDQVSNPDASLTEAVETLFDAYGLIQEILDAEEGSDYQVERLLEGLK